jgi:hypothetical protein
VETLLKEVYNKGNYKISIELEPICIDYHWQEPGGCFCGRSNINVTGADHTPKLSILMAFRKPHFVQSPIKGQKD